VGISGDPVALLRRARALVHRNGRVVVEVAPPGVPTSTSWATLACDGVHSARFRWATVGVDDIGALARDAGFPPPEVRELGGTRWCAVLRMMEG
jgi:hypothetical protein